MHAPHEIDSTTDTLGANMLAALEAPRADYLAEEFVSAGRRQP